MNMFNFSEYKMGLNVKAFFHLRLTEKEWKDFILFKTGFFFAFFLVFYIPKQINAERDYK